MIPPSVKCLKVQISRGSIFLISIMPGIHHTLRVAREKCFWSLWTSSELLSLKAPLTTSSWETFLPTEITSIIIGYSCKYKLWVESPDLSAGFYQPPCGMVNWSYSGLRGRVFFSWDVCCLSIFKNLTTLRFYDFYFGDFEKIYGLQKIFEFFGAFYQPL